MADDWVFGFGSRSFEDLVGKLFGGLVEPQSATRRTDRFGRDLTAAARDGLLDPVIGREDVIDEVLEVLSRRTKNNPVLIGDPGVGKTAVVEGIAARIASGEVPATLSGRRLISLNLAGMVAGAKYRGEFEERLEGVIEEVTAAERMVVLFIDELHVVVGAGSAEGAPMDAATILKPVLTSGRVQVIGATTAEDYRRYVARDAALERRFQPITVAEPSVAEAIAILRGLRGRYEMHHGVRISDEALVSAVELSARYVTDRFLPDKAVDLVDRAGARVRLREKSALPPDPVRLEQRVRQLEREKDAAQGEDAALLTGELDRAVAELEAARAALADAPQVSANDVAEVVSRSTGIPVAQLTEAERHRLLHLEDQLHQRIVGQDEAVEAVADAVRQGRAGLKHPDRPVGSFLFLGPTGVGKTEVARALAEALFGSEDRLIRFDMSEFSQAHAVARLIGVPPGYAGHEEAGQLTGAVRRAPYSVLLLDEIEKAHPDVFNTLLQVLDAGRLTDAGGRTADFSNTVIIMTSNIGAGQLLAAAGSGVPAEQLREPLMAAVRRSFRPEFLNRLDEIILFRGLDAVQLRQITSLLLEPTRQRLREQDITLDVDERAVDWLAARGHVPEYGARPLRRTIGRELDRRLSRALLAGELSGGQHAVVTVSDAELTLTVTDLPD
ncbi:ATP-dependent Clp protease ATP-binding subunit [Lentzea flaviverrucosa]|uniref:ATP-dependent Clp protease ATP-binding subunit ClpC n=1 Tax=Lentzea flaviverrucosa TaxID=200379 RepID=A0A1H9HER4_9PSEU|nr:ATP-dependent Clp protease ATP-binding subunit [Lentzea flaviverrucosa]RDI34611.1 ATP-dependent Clp protease ATP-binding subunit ClpC [Lentzea flaviverrucosa]SEQ60841.1 ATP-dependent Clp protease ATP-binding subunit ClpC [Lentzea flaviverrucosa]